MLCKIGKCNACYSIITRRLMSDSAMHKTAEAAELAPGPPGLLLLIEPVVTAFAEQISDVVKTENVVEAATAPALRVTPLRTNELAPAVREPATTVTAIKSELTPDALVNGMMLVADRVAHGVEVVAVKLRPVVVTKQELTTEEKVTKKPLGNIMKICELCDTPLVVVKDTVALAPVTPGKGLSILSEVVVVAVPVCDILAANTLVC